MPKQAKKDWLTYWAKKAVTLEEKLPEVTGVFRSGSIALDLALFTGGIPEGCLVRLWGPTGSSKSTLCMRAASMALDEGREVLWFDWERALTRTMVEANGMDIANKNLKVFWHEPLDDAPMVYEHMAQMVDAFLEKKKESGNTKGALIVVDTLEAAIPSAMFNGEVGDAHMAIVARINADWFRRLMSLLADTHSTLIMIQQPRAVMNPAPGQDHMAPGGGYAMGFYPMVEIRLRPAGKLDEGMIGSKINVTIKKNRYAHKAETSYNLRMDDWSGIDTVQEIIDCGLRSGVVTQKGAFYRVPSIPDVSFQGGKRLREWLKDDVGRMAALEELIRKAPIEGIAIEGEGAE